MLGGQLSYASLVVTLLGEAFSGSWRRSMMIRGPVCVEHKSLSCAWARALLELFSHGTEGIAPLIVSVTGFEDGTVEEDRVIRAAADSALSAACIRSVRTVANTIFPGSMWNPGLTRNNLYARYKRVLPRILGADSANKYGLYFDRMIAYRPKGASEPINQLEHV